MTGKYLVRNCFGQIEVLLQYFSGGTMNICDKTSVKLLVIGVSLHIQIGPSTDASPEHCW
jgi:hypothetical protein